MGRKIAWAIIVFILPLVLPVNWYLKTFLVFIMMVSFVYLAMTLDEIKGRKLKYKIIITITLIFFLAPLSIYIIRDQWGKDHPPVEIGPRLEFAGLKAEHNSGYYSPSIQVNNTSDIPVTSHFLIGSVFLSDYENNSENKDIQMLITKMEANAQEINLATEPSQIQVTRGTGMRLVIQQQFSDDDIKSVSNGTKKMYVVMLAVYRSPKTPKDEMWVTELCARVTKPFTDFQSCPSYNRYYLSDRFLKKID